MIKGLYEAHLPVKELAVSVPFYGKLGLELAYRNERLAFFWIEKGMSWLGLWETERAETPYHPSLRHVAFSVSREDLARSKEWLENKGIHVKPDFGFSAEQQPLILANFPHVHGAIYFLDPDGNSLELIAPIRLDAETETRMMPLTEWDRQEGQDD